MITSRSRGTKSSKGITYPEPSLAKQIQRLKKQKNVIEQKEQKILKPIDDTKDR